MQTTEKRISICHRCPKHGKPANGVMPCTVSGKDISGHAAADDCPLGLFIDLDESSSVEAIQKHMHILPKHWTNVREAWRLKLREAIADLPPNISESETSIRGIIIAGGGKYFDAAYVTATIIRNIHGSTLPIELWHFSGEVQPWQEKAMRSLAVDCVDASELAKAKGIEPPMSGWGLKSFAVLHCPFDEVYFSDSDSYPMCDPAKFFDNEGYIDTGAMFFPDQERFDPSADLWEAMGAEPCEEVAWETGQFIIDKRRHRKAIHLARWLDSNGAYYHSPQVGDAFGDAFTWHLAFRATESDFAYSSWIRWASVPPAVVQFVGNSPAVIHRINGKFSLNPFASFMSHQCQRRNNLLPLEAEAWTALDELSRTPGRNIVIVELGSFGDLLVMMPAMKWLHEQGNKVTYIGRPPCGELIEGLEWITFVPWYGGNNAFGPAEAFARTLGELRGGFPYIHQKNWSLETWGRTGCPLELFNQLPLAIENRDPAREAELVKQHIKGDGKALLVNVTSARTSPFDGGSDLLEALRREFSAKCEIVDLSQVKAERFQDLTGLYDQAFALVTIDTATLHLGCATKTPTIALIREIGHWRSSEPRPHWRLVMDYPEVKTWDGREKILRQIEALLPCSGCGQKQSPARTVEIIEPVGGVVAPAAIRV